MMNKISLISAIFLSSVMVSNADLNWHDTSVSASGGTDFSNPVFDVFFLENEIVYLGSQTEQEKIPEGKLDPNIRSGEAWDTKYNKDTVKSAIMSGINYWTDTITNRLDSNQQKLKIAVAFGTQEHFYGVNGFASYMTIDARKTRSLAGYNEEIQANGNYRTVIEAALRDNDITFRTDNDSTDRNINAKNGCVDVFLGFNLGQIEATANTSEKDFAKMISATVAHELGHAMGLSSQLYKGFCDKVDSDGFWDGTQNCVTNDADMTKLDTLLYVKNDGGDLVRLAQIENGIVVPCKFTDSAGNVITDFTLAETLAKLGNTGAPLVVSDGENTLQVANGIDFGKGFEFVEGSSIEHLFILDQDGYQHDILGTYSSTLEFSENDLKLIKMLGYGLATIPEPSTVSLFAGCCAFALVGIRRRKNNVG